MDPVVTGAEHRGGLGSVVADLLTTSVVVVVRTKSSTGMVELARALVDGGVRHIEITTTVPHALEAISTVADALGDEIHVGAGTVLDQTTARCAIQAGAGYLVSPILDRGVIEIGHQYGVPVIPGCMTPTEVATAMRWGADCIKLFPGRVATPGFFADILGPLPSARLMPTGNVDESTAPQYLAAGAVAVGVGKAIVAPDDFAAQNWRGITERAVRFTGLIRQAKAAS